MNKKYAKVQSTRRSLIMSILSLMLCFAMLIGTTYAWFTDSVTSGKNRIVAGNLDVELTHSNAKVTTPESVQGSTDLFKFEKVGESYKEVLWEPGMVVYENFTVSNVGNLALKYALSLNVFDKNTYNGKDLTEVIKVATYDGELTATTRDAMLATENLSAFTSLSDFQKQGNLVGKSGTTVDSDTYGVVLYWEPTDNDNLYNVNNGQKTDDNGTELFIEFGINLVATQDTVEFDSFDNQYDKFASFSLDFKKMTEKLAEDGTEDLIVKKTGIIEEAKVPAKAANTVFDTLSAEAPAEFKKQDGSLKDDVSQELVLTLDVERQEATGTTQKYEIDMTAVMDFIIGSEKKTVTEEVKNFEEYLTIVVNVEPGLDDVNVDHNGKNMIKLSSASEVPSTKVDNGYYFYDKTTGKLTMKTWSLSPFKVIWTNLLTVTPESSPVKSNPGTESGYFKFENDKYSSALVTGSLASQYYPALEYSEIVLTGVTNGDILYLSFEQDFVYAGVESHTQYIENAATNGQSAQIVQKDSKSIVYTVNTIGKNGNVILKLSNYTGHFDFTIKIDHREPPKVTTQPTAESKTVVATGDNITYQWYKVSDEIPITTTESTDVYAKIVKGSYENGIYKTAKAGANQQSFNISIFNLKQGDIVKYNGTLKPEVACVADVSEENPAYNDMPQNGYTVTESSHIYKISIPKFSATETVEVGTFSVSSPNEKLINETGAKLGATEPGKYQCVITDAHGNQVSSNIITLN